MSDERHRENVLFYVIYYKLRYKGGVMRRSLMARLVSTGTR